MDGSTNAAGAGKAIVANLSLPELKVVQARLLNFGLAMKAAETRLEYQAQKAEHRRIWQCFFDKVYQCMGGAGCSDGKPNELTYVDRDTFLATF